MTDTAPHSTEETLEWHKVAEPGDLPEGRVRTVTVDRRSLALTRCGGQYGALDNRCHHQGGPLGEGCASVVGVDGRQLRTDGQAHHLALVALVSPITWLGVGLLPA